MVPLLFTDPLGDDHGLGYGYPRSSLYAEVGYADLTGFEALQQGGKLVLRLRLARYPNPQNAPQGFSLPVIGVYVDTEAGGSTTLPGAGFATPLEDGWDVAYKITGWGTEEYRTTGSGKPVAMTIKQDWLEVYPDLPPKDYGYYIAVGLYDPFVPWNFRPARPGGGAWLMDAPVEAPRAVDVLSMNQTKAYQTATLYPVRTIQSRLPWVAISALAGMVCLALAFRFPRVPPLRRNRRVRRKAQGERGGDKGDVTS
jgi:carbohydrate-binding DOMON domain-containing protein